MSAFVAGAGDGKLEPITMGQLEIRGSLQAARLRPPLSLNFPREHDEKELRISPSSFVSFPGSKTVEVRGRK